ncbi:MAG TPA: hypothetical protein VF981_17730 [Gemmatimonadaceae bacterium]
MRDLSSRLVLALALGYAAPMATMWFVAPFVPFIADALGLSDRGGRAFRWIGIIPLPDPFTWRAWIGLALIIVPPVLFGVTWLILRRSSPGTR